VIRILSSSCKTSGYIILLELYGSATWTQLIHTRRRQNSCSPFAITKRREEEACICLKIFNRTRESLLELRIHSGSSKLIMRISLKTISLCRVGAELGQNIPLSGVHEPIDDDEPACPSYNPSVFRSLSDKELFCARTTAEAVNKEIAAIVPRLLPTRPYIQASTARVRTAAKQANIHDSRSPQAPLVTGSGHSGRKFYDKHLKHTVENYEKVSLAVTQRHNEELPAA